MTSLVRVEKDLPLYPSSLFNPFFVTPLTTTLLLHSNTLLFPGIYQLSPPQSQSVSVSQPLSSTSMRYHAPLRLLGAPSPPPCFNTSTPSTTTSTQRPSGNHVNPKPIRGGLTGASEDSRLPFAPLLSGG